jgi:hypothetical protein
MMMPLIGISILLILIGLVVFSTAKSKTPGLMMGMLFGGGALFVIAKSSEARSRSEPHPLCFGR